MRNKSPVMVFKKFAVRHDRVAMKVGTDGVLLGAWTSVENAQHILDIGTGSGVIALMLAQRTGEGTVIDAVEVSADAAQAHENFEASPWKHRLRIHRVSLQQFTPGVHYDLMVANPPYFVESLKPPDEKRTLARHTVTLDHSDILVAAQHMLQPNGRLSLILPFAEAAVFEEQAGQHELFCRRQCAFRSRPTKMPLRYLLEFSRHPGAVEKSEICLYGTGNEPSAEYRSLTGDFYLNF